MKLVNMYFVPDNSSADCVARSAGAATAAASSPDPIFTVLRRAESPVITVRPVLPGETGRVRHHHCNRSCGTQSGLPTLAPTLAWHVLTIRQEVL